MAFISHTTIVTVMKDSTAPQNNVRSITWAYVMTAILYGMLGIFGGIAISNHNYLEDPAFLIAKGILMFLYIGSIFSIFPFVSRTQFFCFLPEVSTWKFYGYNAIIWLCCVILQVAIL